MVVGKSAPQVGALTARIRVNGSPCDASLTPDGRLTWRAAEEDGAGAGERCLQLESEALGLEIEGGRRIRVRALVGDAKVAVSCGVGGGVGKRSRKDYVLEMDDDEMVDVWGEALADCFNSFGRPTRLFIFLNPFGGKKCARKIFHDEVKPLLEAANVLYTLQETKYQLHAQEIAYKMDLLKYDGIVCVSGDGVLVEIVNGLLQREDWDTAIKVPLGIIPAGTGNGMAKSLLDAVGETFSISNATFSVIRGHKRSLDVTTVRQGAIKFFSVLMLSWGYVADVDIESEKYRWLGSARIDFYSLVRVMNLRKYHGRVHFVPAPGYEAFGEPSQNGDLEVVTETSSHVQENGDQVQQSGYQGPSVSPESLQWRFLDGPFVSVWLNNVRFSGEDIMAAPEAKFSDGHVDVVITRDMPKSSMLAWITKVADGSHVKSPYVTYLKVKAFRIEPGHRVGNPTKGGIIDCDGEILARGDGTYECHQRGGDLMKYGPPIDMYVDQGLATIFSPR